MSCWLVSTLSDTQSGFSNHTAHVLPGGRGPRGDLHRAEHAVCSHPPPTLHLLVIWCEMELKLDRITPKQSLSPNFPCDMPQFAHFYSLINTRWETFWQPRSIQTCLQWPREDTAYTNAVQKHKREWDIENRYLERVKTFWAAPSEIFRNWHVDSLGKHSTIKLRRRGYILWGEMHCNVLFF